MDLIGFVCLLVVVDHIRECDGEVLHFEAQFVDDELEPANACSCQIAGAGSEEEDRR